MRVPRLILLLAVGLLVVGASAAHAASPRIVIISGKPLDRQIVISDWGDVSHVVAGAVASRVAPRADLANRPRLTFSMFWGPKWIDYLSSGKRASALRPRHADQRGSFYPAWNGRPALIDLPWARQWPRHLTAKALLTLMRHGVPIRLA